jgi:hypothetical protein
LNPAESGTTLDPSGASTSGTTPAPHPSMYKEAHNLRDLEKVDYKELHTGKQQFLKRCISTRASVRKQDEKSVAKVSKVTDMFLPIY